MDAALAQGDLALAEKRYQQVLAQQPDNALALDNLAAITLSLKKPAP